MDFWSREGNLMFCPYLLGGNFFDYFLDWRSKYYVFLDIRPSPLRVLFHFRASRSKKASKLAKMSNWLWQPKNDPQNRPLITIWSPKYKKMLKLAYQVFKVPNSDQKWGIWAYLSSQIFGNKSTYLLTYLHTMSAVQMAVPIGTPFQSWNLTFSHFSHSQVLLGQPNHPFRPLDYKNRFKNITFMAI